MPSVFFLTTNTKKPRSADLSFGFFTFPLELGSIKHFLNRIYCSSHVGQRDVDVGRGVT